MMQYSLPGDSLVNYVFPNNLHIDWSLMIVMYPYITGLVAGAFALSSLCHVFGVCEFRPLARFALVVSFCFGLVAGVPLLIHLGQPQRAFNILITPNLTSPMSLFGYVYGAYMLLLSMELWLTYRLHFIRKANETGNFFWKVLTLGVYDYTEASAKADERLFTVLSVLGIPTAFVLHGYVGYVFGSVKAVAWWATPLQPIIFIMSAIVSGMAMLFLLYTVIRKWNGNASDYLIVRKLMEHIFAAFLLTIVLELWEVAYVFNEDTHHWKLIGPLLKGPLFYSYVVGQMGILSGIPLVLLSVGIVFKRLSDRMMLVMANLASLLLVLQVLFMRFNVVIGGQLLSKSERGFATYHFEWFAKEGIIPAFCIMLMPFLIYAIITRFIPVFDPPEEEASSLS